MHSRQRPVYEILAAAVVFGAIAVQHRRADHVGVLQSPVSSSNQSVQRAMTPSSTTSISIPRPFAGRLHSSITIAVAALTMLPFLQTQTAQGKAAINYERVSFQLLKRYKPGKRVPPEIEALNGKSVEILGFMAALTQLEDIDEFVLSSAPPLNCYCSPPLFINELISVKMNGNKRVSFKGGVVKIKGRLIVNTEIRDEFTDVMYTLRADALE